MVIYIQYKFYESPSMQLLTMLWLKTEKSLKFRQLKGHNSIITDDTPTKFQVHNLTMVIYIQYKFHESPSIGYIPSYGSGWKKIMEI